MKKIYILASMLLLSGCQAADRANTVRWEAGPVHEVDLDCDGHQDPVHLGFVGNDFVIQITPSTSDKASQLRFPLEMICAFEMQDLGPPANPGLPEKCDTLPPGDKAPCPELLKFSSHTATGLAQYFNEVFGTAPETYLPPPGCFLLHVADGLCDGVHIIYNQKTGELHWWRL